MVMALAMSTTSWSEFQSHGRKLERYTVTVRSLKNLHIWWNSLGEAEKASCDNATRLIISCENILMNEYQTWASATASFDRKFDGKEIEVKSEATGQGIKSNQVMPFVSIQQE